MHPIRLLLPLALFACKPDPADTGPVDTDPDSDTDTEPLEELAFAGFVTSLPDVPREGDLAVSLVAVELGDPIVAGDTLGSIPVTGTGVFRIVLDESGPPAEHLRDALYPGTDARGALYVPTLHDDEDADAAYTDGEAIAGVNRGRWLAWHESPAPSGYPEGWTLVSIDRTGSTAPTFEALGLESEIVLRGGLSEVDLRGGWAGDVPDVPHGLVALDHHLVTDGVAADSYPLDLQVVDGSFSEIVDSRPGGDHFYKDGAAGLWYAVELLLVYEDDGDSAYEQGVDSVSGQAVCYQGEPVYLRYVAVPSTLQDAFGLDEEGWAAGWRAWQGSGSSYVELEATQTRLLTLDPSCTVSLP